MSCHYLVRCFEKICDNLGVPLASEKLVGPTTKLTNLGLEISIPADKFMGGGHSHCQVEGRYAAVSTPFFRRVGAP